MNTNEIINPTRELKLTKAQETEISDMVELHKNHFIMDIRETLGLWNELEQALRAMVATEPRSMFQRFRVNDRENKSLPALVFDSKTLITIHGVDRGVAVIRYYDDQEEDNRERIMVSGPASLDLGEIDKKRYLFTSPTGKLISLTFGLEVAKKKHPGDFVYLEQWGVTLRASQVIGASRGVDPEKGQNVMVNMGSHGQMRLGLESEGQAESFLLWLHYQLNVRS